MDIEALQELAKVRAQVDTKSLKKTIKDFYRLVNPELTGEELQAAHETFMIGFDQLAQQLSKTTRLQRVTEMEVQGYVVEARSIEATSVETTEKLSTLSEHLVAAQQERARRIEYDVIAKTIGKLPDREKGKESKVRLEADIATLRQEEQTYVETWKQRKEAFDAIVTSLETMGEAIKDEKMEQERRRALDEDDGDGDEVLLDPTAKPFEPAKPLEEGGTPTVREEDGSNDEPEEAEAMEGVELEEGQEPEEKEEGEMELTS